MNTIRKTTALILSMGISIFGFSQVNLGLQSTTNAAIHATANTAAILQTTHAASVAAKNTVKTTSAETKSTTQETTGTVQTTTNSAKNKVDGAVTTEASVSSQSNVTAANNSAATDINNGNSADLKTGTSISRVKIVDNGSYSSSSEKTQAASGAALNTGEEIKTRLQDKTKSTIMAGEEKVKASSSTPAVTANARAESKTTVVK